MSFPTIANYTIPVVDAGGIELLLADAVQVPQYFASSSQEGNVLVGVPDGATVKKLSWGGAGSLTTVGNSITMHDDESDSDYTIPASGSHKVILIVSTTGTASNLRFRVWSHGTADTTPGSGTPEYDYTSTTKLDASSNQTTEILTGFTASDFINVELEATGAGGIARVEGWVVEIPPA